MEYTEAQRIAQTLGRASRGVSRFERGPGEYYVPFTVRTPRLGRILFHLVPVWKRRKLSYLRMTVGQTEDPALVDLTETFPCNGSECLCIGDTGNYGQGLWRLNPLPGGEVCMCMYPPDGARFLHISVLPSATNITFEG